MTKKMLSIQLTPQCFQKRYELDVRQRQDLKHSVMPSTAQYWGVADFSFPKGLTG